MLKNVTDLSLSELDEQFHQIIGREAQDVDALEILELSGGFAVSNPNDSKRGSATYFMSAANNGEKVFGASHVEVMKRAFVISRLGSQIKVSDAS